MKAFVVTKTFENAGYEKREIAGVFVGSDALRRAWNFVELEDSLTEFPDIETMAGGKCIGVDYVDVSNSRVFIYRGTEPGHLDDLFYVTYNVIETEVKY